MYDFSKISVKRGPTRELLVENNSDYPMIDKGAHGAVFQVDEDKCVKIYWDKTNCDLESEAYRIAQDSIIVPRLYDVGKDFILMEYIKGISLEAYLKKINRVPTHIARQLVFMIKEMERLGFKRCDSALRHIIIDSNETLKVVDIVYANTKIDPKPVRLFEELQNLGFLESFMKKVNKIDIDLYTRWNHEGEAYILP